MTSLNKNLQPSALHEALSGFWSSSLTIEQEEGRVHLALPQTDAEGWQQVIEITEPTPGVARISDAGRVLSQLANAGQNIDSGSTSRHIAEISRNHHMTREGLELVRLVSLPLNPVDVHVFAEGLSAISHLWVLHEANVRTLDLADQTIQRVFKDHHIEPRKGASLTGSIEKSVRVDYLVESRNRVAVEIIRRKNNLYPLMEQWGFRWMDLKKADDRLLPVMLYDPASVDIDEDSRAIGEGVCRLFSPYDETGRIHQVLEEAGASA